MSLYTLRGVMADERRCLLFLKKLRWPNRVACPHCGGRATKSESYRWRCPSCRYRFSVTSGTVFHGRRLLLSQMVWIVGLLEYGLSSLSIAKTLGVTDKTVRSFIYAVGKKLGAIQNLREFIAVSEVDETYWGGKRKGKRGRGAAGKTPVLGIKDRGGHARLLAIPNVKGSTLRREIRKRAAKGSWVVSDTFHSYDRLWRDGYNHAAINHDVAYALGEIHTQGIEGTWGHMQPKLKASHRQISSRHLQNYLDIFSWNFGNEKPQDYLMDTLVALLSPVPPTT